MSRYWILALGALVAAAALVSIDAWVMAATVKSPAMRRALLSGVDLQYVDPSVRPQDDLYRHLNGKWLDSFQIPADKGSYGSFTYLYDATQEQLRGIVDGLDGSGDAEARKIADLYASFMDESRLEALGLKPLQAEFAAIDAISDKKEIPALIAHLNRIGAGAPYAFPSIRMPGILCNTPSSSAKAVWVCRIGTTTSRMTPSSRTRAPNIWCISTKCSAWRATRMRKAHAAAILDLETALAQVQWTRVENRDPIKTYNKTAIAELAAADAGLRLASATCAPATSQARSTR